MKNRFIIGLVIIIVVVGGIVFISNTKKATPENTAPTTQSQSTSPEMQPSGSMAKDTITPVKAQTITLTKDGFSPQTVTIKAGEKVAWMNRSGKTATVNSNPHPIHTDYPPLNLGEFKNGDTLELTFSKPGTYGYHNHYNAFQGGKVIVK